MNRERFLKTEQLFNDALAQTIDRDGWVTRACGSDTELQDELRALLAEHENLAALPNEPELLPKFGVWQALRVLGRGGMGTVYLSDRADGAFQMQAAVKVVPLALASSEIEARFRREREFLAGLEHPGITRLIDGGVSELGMPYLVMEFVEGVAIDRYCIDGDLPARARVELVRQVLAALAYVHAQKVIHRDLKPSNVLVNAGGRAKLLDFGIARLAEVGAGADLTRTGLAAFTPDYASPEQLRGGIASYRSDLYSVGVLFYRVLTGRLPAKQRYLTAGCGRSIDSVLEKALAEDPANRYESAEGFDADLVRYLEGKSIAARPNRRWLGLAVPILAAAALVFWYFDGTIRVTVPSSTDIWLAGQPDGSRLIGQFGFDLMPRNAPTTVKVAPGDVLSISATGITSIDGLCFAPADGGCYPDESRFGVGPANGIGVYRGPSNALLGVFLGDGTPTGSLGPESLDYTQPENRMLPELSPKLNQIFLIGSGAKKKFHAPPGATRLFLAVADSLGSSTGGNTGELKVRVGSISIAGPKTARRLPK